MSATFDDSFPKLPECAGRWAAIYMEPAINCGERIAIAVVATTKSGETKAVRAIHEQTVSSLYGSGAVAVNGQIRWVMESARDHIDRDQSIANWSPPISGIYVGEMRDAFSSSVDGILKQGLRMSASLSTLMLTSDADETRNEGFADRVRKACLDQNPELAQYWNTRRRVSEHGSGSKFHVATDSYVANLSELNVARVGESINAARLRVYHLSSLRKYSDLFPAGHLELILGAPSNMELGIPERTVDKIHAEKEGLTETADAHEIVVYEVPTVEAAVARVIQRAA